MRLRRWRRCSGEAPPAPPDPTSATARPSWRALRVGPGLTRPDAAARRVGRARRKRQVDANVPGRESAVAMVASGFLLLAMGRLHLDLGWGRSLHELGPISVRIEAPRELVFQVLGAPYLGTASGGSEVELIARDGSLAVAAHFTRVHFYTARTVEVIELDAPGADRLPTPDRPRPARGRVARADAPGRRDRAPLRQRAGHRLLLARPDRRQALGPPTMGVDGARSHGGRSAARRGTGRAAPLAAGGQRAGSAFRRALADSSSTRSVPGRRGRCRAGAAAGDLATARAARPGESRARRGSASRGASGGRS